MGGPGSGNWYRFDKQGVVEDYSRLEVRRLQQAGILQPGMSLLWVWRNGKGEQTASINIDCTGDSVTLRYTVTTDGKSPEDVRYPVPIVWTPCTYGGRRPWFLCPGRGCDRRVAMLYIRSRYFLCRHCQELAYESQRERPEYRLMHKAQEIHRRLGGSGSMMDLFPEKPRGMHWRTYWRLFREAEAADAQALAIIGRRLDRQEVRIPEIVDLMGRLR